MHPLRHKLLILSGFACVFSSFACSALKSFEKVEKSTTEVGEKMDETNDGIDRTNRKMDETNDGINKTNNKMDEMKDEMGSMNDKLITTNKRMDNMNNALDRMYHDLRQGDSLAARLQTIEKLSQSPSLKGKTVFAAQYFMSFEYQLWKGEGPDGNALREILKRDAVDEFVQTLRRFSKTSLPISLMSTDKDLLSIEALAMTSHMQNSNSALVMNSKNIPLSSMHSLLRESLEFGHKLAHDQISSSDIPEYAVFALREPELVRYIFELRINMFPALVLSKLTQVSSDDFVTRWWSRANVWLKPWNADLAQKNALELKECSTWLDWASADLKFLKSIGVKARLDNSAVKILRNARLMDSSRPSSAVPDAARTAAKTELKRSLESFLGSIP